METDEIFKLTRRGIADLLRSPAHAAAAHSGNERRQTPRGTFPATVEIYPAGGDGTERWFGTCRNLSETGLGMSCDRHFDPEMPLDIAIHLPEASLCGRAVVRYCMETPHGFMVGLEFDFQERTPACEF